METGGNSTSHAWTRAPRAVCRGGGAVSGNKLEELKPERASQWLSEGDVTTRHAASGIFHRALLRDRQIMLAL